MLTEGQGIPLAVVVAGANRHDMKLLADTLDAVVVERPEPTAQAPQHVCLDKGYDYDECRQVAEQHEYIPHIRSRGEEQWEKREIPDYRPRRWVVERTIAWGQSCLRLAACYERSVKTFEVLVPIAWL